MSERQERPFPLLREPEQVWPSHQLPKQTSLALRGREAGKDFFVGAVERGLSLHPLVVQNWSAQTNWQQMGYGGKDLHLHHPHRGIIWREGVNHESMNWKFKCVCPCHRGGPAGKEQVLRKSKGGLGEINGPKDKVHLCVGCRFTSRVELTFNEIIGIKWVPCGRPDIDKGFWEKAPS